MRNFTRIFKLKDILFQLLFLSIFTIFGQNMILLEQDWESGIGSWFASNGTWEVGIPTAGPSVAHSGQNCAGTVLGGNYSAGVNTRLESPISPTITLPIVSPEERIQLKFWHWYRNSDDNGRIQISVNGGAWQTISDRFFDGTSSVWTQHIIDLTAYADSTIRIGFFFSSGNFNSDNGWYIDDILVEKKTVNFNNPEDFETGVGDWSADNGVWQIGIPGVGPQSTHSGQNCAGTFLDANYAAGANTRLISPRYMTPDIAPNESVLLKFWHWYGNSDDNGQVQISVNDGEWQTISTTPFDGTSKVWSQYVADISAYASSVIRIAFNFNSGNFNSDNGWYIDDISVEKKTFTLSNPESFENGAGDWSADNGIWQIGIPSAGPSNANSGQNCAGTVLSGTYPSGANTRLVSPKVKLSTFSGQSPILFFWHWFRLSDDQGSIQISVNDGEWQTVGGPFTGTSPVWTQAPPVDLSAYTDSTVQIAFNFISGNFNSDDGWYVDDIRIEGVTSLDDIKNDFMPSEFKLLQNFPNPFNPSTTIHYHLPKASQVELVIYNTLGQRVRMLVNEKQNTGIYKAQWNGMDENEKMMSSGIYILTLKAGPQMLNRKMILLR